jgi:transcriptional regulator with XRE-family HTH domain
VPHAPLTGGGEYATVPTLMTLRLRQWREARGLSVRALAAQAGVNYVTVVRIEGGRLSPTVALLAKLARALGITVRDFFPVEPRPRPRVLPRRPRR